jgi:hypothetical protein
MRCQLNDVVQSFEMRKYVYESEEAIVIELGVFMVFLLG